MNNKISKELKASIVYTIATLLSKGITVITLPLFTRIMSPTQIGIVNIYTSWQSIVYVVVTLSLTSGGYMIALKEFKDERDQYTSSILSLTTLMGIVFFFIYIIFSNFFVHIFQLTNKLILLMILGFIFTPAVDLWMAYQRYEYKYVKVGIYLIFSSVLSSLGSLVAVFFANQKSLSNLGEIRLISGNMILYIFSLVIWVFVIFKGKTFFNCSYWKYSIKLSLPLIANSIAMQILNVSDRTMIASLVGKNAVGIYSVLYSVSSIPLMIWGALNSSFVPFLFENIDKKENNYKIRKISTSLMGSYAVIAFLITLLAPEIVRILATDEYYSAIYIIPPIAIGIYLISVSNMYSNILIYYKKTSVIMIASVLSASINILLNSIFIKRYGFVAAAYTTFVAYAVLSLVQYYVAHKVQKKLGKKTVYEDKKIILIGILLIVCSLFMNILYTNTAMRYVVIVGIIVFFVINKDKLINLVKYSEGN